MKRNRTGADSSGNGPGKEKFTAIRRAFIMALFVLSGIALCNCASQHKHHKAIPCPCEKQNKR